VTWGTVRRITAGGLETAVTEAGPAGAPPVLLLHGGGIDRAAQGWLELAPRLADRFRLIAPDLPGYGETAPYRRAHRLDELGGWAGEIIAGIGEPVAVVGNSMGGGIGLWLALNRPEAVSRLVCLDAYGLADRAPAVHRLLHRYARGNASQAIRYLVRRRWGARLAARAIFAEARRIPEAMIDGLMAEAAVQLDHRAFRDFLRGEVLPDRFRHVLWSRLDEVRCPVLYLHGRADPIVPHHVSLRAARHTPRGRAVILPAGHQPQRERPVEVAALVTAFLARPLTAPPASATPEPQRPRAGATRDGS